MITERIIITAILCATLCFLAWCGSRPGMNRKKGKKDGNTDEG